MLDVQEITALGDGELTDAAVAGYIAKYATKSAEDSGRRPLPGLPHLLRPRHRRRPYSGPVPRRRRHPPGRTPAGPARPPARSANDPHRLGPRWPARIRGPQA